MTANFVTRYTGYRVLLGGLLLFAWAGMPAVAGELPEQIKRQCAFDPATGKANPLGMRAFITIEQTQTATRVTYAQLPVPLSHAPDVALDTSRVLVFANKTIEEVRSMLEADVALYSALVGYQDDEGFAAVNASLACSQVQVRN